MCVGFSTCVAYILEILPACPTCFKEQSLSFIDRFRCYWKKLSMIFSVLNFFNCDDVSGSHKYICIFNSLVMIVISFTNYVKVVHISFHLWWQFVCGLVPICFKFCSWVGSAVIIYRSSCSLLVFVMEQVFTHLIVYLRTFVFIWVIWFFEYYYICTCGFAGHNGRAI
jgi:hypothetical protein